MVPVTLNLLSTVITEDADENWLRMMGTRWIKFWFSSELPDYATLAIQIP